MDSISYYLPWFFRPSRLGAARSLVLGLTLGFSLSLSLTTLTLYSLDAFKRKFRRDEPQRIIEIKKNEVLDGVESLIGTYIYFSSTDESEMLILSAYFIR